MKKKIKIIAYLNKSYSRIVRFEQQAKYLNRTGDYECVISPTEVKDEQLLWADIIFLSNIVDPKMISDIWAYKMERGKKVVVDRDDALRVSKDNPFATLHQKQDVYAWSRELIKIADVVTVTNSTIKKSIKEFNPNIHILPNYLDLEMWGARIIKNESPTLRIGWVGSITHRDDVMEVLPIIKKIIMKHNAKFVFCGDDFYIKEFQDIPKNKWEYVVGTKDFYSYPTFAHTLALDIAIAPLKDTPFARARSYLKYLEYGIMKIPGVYSSIVYDKVIEQGTNGFIAKTPEEWEKYLELLISSKVTRDYIAENAFNNVYRYHSIGKEYKRWDRLFKSLITTV
jgi:glycosyltransferase involved in cell wall biosynthesis